MKLNISFTTFKKNHKNKKDQLTYEVKKCKDYKQVENIFNFILAEKNSFIFESVEKGTIRGRYTIIGLNPDKIWDINKNVITEKFNGKKKITLKDIKDETIFNSNIIKEIFKVKDGNLQLITNSSLTKNYLIFAEKTEKFPFGKNIKDYVQYKTKARLNLANQIYSNFDQTINSKYKVEINKKVLSRIKNTL